MIGIGYVIVVYHTKVICIIYLGVLIATTPKTLDSTPERLIGKSFHEWLVSKIKRIARVRRSNVLSDIYGSLYNDYQMTRSTKPNVRKQAIKLINQLSSSEIQLHHESELNKIRELHTLLYKILNAIKMDTNGSIMTIDIDKFNRINKVIKGYNEYVKDNDIFRLKYNYSLIPIILPSNICFLRRGKPIKVRRVIKQLTNVGIGKGGCSSIKCRCGFTLRTIHRDVINGKRLIIYD